jgi:tetratricopeptide (TPR) repeat protein
MVTPEDSYRRIARPTASPANPAPNAQDLLGQAMRSLRLQHDPASALAILARHAALFPQSPLAGERTQLEVESLLSLGRYPEALLRLDGMDLTKIPRTAERLVVRGELRAQARRWNEAAADFDQALTHFKGSSPWHERALWGRATTRAHAGDRDGSRADMRLYLQVYPQGRFAAEATRLTDPP